ncbi:hypothetical protein MCHI_003963 [Candidatus Magnetoovum chiemensis]|nr:hypothetical protein MCHI_003963 [Candidatus Magnetoovum chiemensis]
MRHFYSYGPIDCAQHFCAPRVQLIESCTEHLLGGSDKGGHYFTIWAPRQTGKTWIMRQVKDAIQAKYGDKLIVGTMSMQGTIFTENELIESFWDKFPKLIWETFKLDIKPLNSWGDLTPLFYRGKGLFDRPVILFIDEFDSLPAKVIDILVTLFRDMYLKRDAYLLHGLALIGVRAALGVESERGSPFNIQRSMHIPNFTKDEVFDLFRQYIAESGQNVEEQVIENVYSSTRGQPGLVCWFGELLTEKYNPDIDKPIDTNVWDNVYNSSLTIEWNNTILNLIKKAKSRHKGQVMELFSKSDITFSMDKDWCAYLYMNGIIDNETVTDDKGKRVSMCRFSSPFVQERLYNALTADLVGDRLPIPAIEILDGLEDVFGGDRLNVQALLQRYIAYLTRLKSKGLNPWKDQPRRADLSYTEAVGHFHLYAWLQAAVGRQCVISPEFPTGNGKVDLHLRCADKDAIIEVKSLTTVSALKGYKDQAAKYALELGKDAVTIALFVASDELEVLERLSSDEIIGAVKVTVSPIGWTAL